MYGAQAANGIPGVSNVAGSNVATGGVTPYPGLQSVTQLGARYNTFANGNSPGWDHAGNAGNPTANGGAPTAWADNGAFPNEPVWTTLAVALSGYANNKGASFEDLYANALSAAAGGPLDALGNGILGALNTAGQSEGSTWWWAAAYAVNHGVFRNGSALVSPTNDAYRAPTTPAAAWLNNTLAPSLAYKLLPAGWAPVPGGDGVNNWADPTSGQGGLKVDYQTVTGFNFPSPYYGLRLITSLYNLLYVEFPTGFELYDFTGSVSGTADPWQLTNVYSAAPPALKLALAANLEQLKICKGNGNLAGGHTPSTSVSCVLANVPAFTAVSAPAVAVASVTSALTLAGYSKATFDINAQAAFLRVLSTTLGVATSAVSISSIAANTPASGRHLLSANDAVTVATVVAAPSAAVAKRIQSNLAVAAASPQLLTALQAALPQTAGLSITAPTLGAAVPPSAGAATASAAGRAAALPVLSLLLAAVVAALM